MSKDSFVFDKEKNLTIEIVPRGTFSVEGQEKEFNAIEWKIRIPDLFGDSLSIETAKNMVKQLEKAIEAAEKKNEKIKE